FAADRRRLALVRLAELPQSLRHRLAQLLGLERDSSPVLAQDPAGERLQAREDRLEDAVLERAGVGERPLHPPSGVLLNGDARTADVFADLPRPGHAMRFDVEVGGKPEVALAPGGEADVAADARDAECADRAAVEVLPDDVPDAFVEPERI